MDYLLMKLVPYLVLAFGIGMFVGFYSCRRAED